MQEAIMVWRAVVLLFVGAGFGLAASALGPARFVPWTFAAATTCEGGSTPITEVSAADAQTLCAEPGLVIADARPADRFAAGHIAAAVHLPCSSEAQRAQALQNAAKVLVYADSTDEARPVANALAGRLGARVVVLQGGFVAWVAAGQACASGPCESCKAGVSHPDEPHSGAHP